MCRLRRVGGGPPTRRQHGRDRASRTRFFARFVREPSQREVAGRHLPAVDHIRNQRGLPRPLRALGKQGALATHGCLGRLALGPRDPRPTRSGRQCLGSRPEQEHSLSSRLRLSDPSASAGLTGSPVALTRYARPPGSGANNTGSVPGRPSGKRNVSKARQRTPGSVCDTQADGRAQQRPQASQ
jgi:hypothetical protein